MRHAQKRRTTGIHWSTRILLLVGVFGYYLRDYLFPHGFPVPIPMHDRIHYAAVDVNNDSLQAKHGKLIKIVERMENNQTKPLLKGPETVIVDNKGTMYAFCRGANLVRVDHLKKTDDPQTMTAQVSIVAHLGQGAPLSGKFTNDGKTLYVADPIQGLFRIRNFHDKHPTIELVAHKVMDDNGIMTRILFVDDVAIGPKTGKVYFSDATDIPPDRLIKEEDWDVMYASKVDFVRGKRTGRLLQYDPETEEVKVLAQDLFFANGVAVDKEETYVAISQTFDMRLSKYYLTGPEQGKLQTVIDSTQLTGFTDGADCSWEAKGASAGKCYVAILTSIPSLVKVLQVIPPPIDQAIRFVLLMLPKWLTPKPIKYGCVVEVEMETGEIRTLQDPDGTDLKFITGVTVFQNKLYLGSLLEDVVGIYDLN